MNKSAAFALKCVLSACFFWTGGASAFEPAQAPLILGGQVEPNVTLLMDDSGSMAWGYMPDSLNTNLNNSACNFESASGDNWFYNCAITGRAHYFSSEVNRIYFDPSAVYPPPPGFTNASFTAAKLDGYSGSSPTISLATSFRAPFYTVSYAGGAYYDYFYIGPAAPAFYYQQSTNCIDRLSDSCYTKTNIGNDAALRQRFANWFSYYRTRMLAAKSGVSAAFFPQTSAIRVGWGSINKGSSSIDGISTRTLNAGVRAFSGTSRQDFYDWIRDLQPEGGTPLRRALDDAGQYYSRTDDRGPWSTTPGVSGGKDLACRQSYTMLTTDGYWNGIQASTAAAQKDVDGDGVANTLADVAKHYWETDLYGGLANNVPTSVLNKQKQQHMVTIGVALGLEGDLSPTKKQAFDAVINGTENQLNWPDPIASGGNARLLDLLHASANGRGDFFNAQNPAEFAKALSSSLVSIADLSASNTPRTVSSARLKSDTLLYEASYESGNWTGKLRAYRPVEMGAGLQYALQWEAGSKIGSGTRKLVYGSSTGVAKGTAMNWTSMSSANKALFNNDELLFNYINGNRLNEAPNGKGFRARTSLLGDVVNASVIAVNRRDFGYLPSRTGLTGYADFLKLKKERPSVVYVGSNDGFLHAFDGNNGGELFGFMPHGVMDKVKSLADTNYQHRFLVDGKLHEHDAFISSPADTARNWKTVLVGGLGAGGRSVFALDVTDASGFSNKSVMWEFTDPDMGYTFGEPVVGLLANGSWGAIFGNGYGKKADGTLLDSVLYVVNLETGALIQKKVLATGTGGLASPGYVYSPVGETKKFAITNIYVGDRGGNLWKLNAKNNGTFDTAFSGSPLFRAIHGTGVSAKVQPITVRPVIAAHPTVTDTHMVYFGTGSYASYDDISSTRINEVQSVYGIWGNGLPSGSNNFGTVSSRGSLEEVKITAEYTTSDYSSGSELKSDMRIVEEKESINWANRAGWYMDLLTKGTTKEGERVVSQPEIISKSLVFKTTLPSTDPCMQSDNGWLMAMDLATGGRLTYTVWDYNKDGVVDDRDDLLAVGDGEGTKGTGIRDGDILPTGGLLIGESKCYYYGVVVNCETRPSAGRVSWEQLDEQ